MNRTGALISSNADDTLRWGQSLAAELHPGDAVFLIGSLGVGKTVLARGLARGLGCEGIVNSPSFTLLKTYKGRLKMHHLDLYRLKPGDDLRDLGLEEILDGESVSVFEWCEKFSFAHIMPRWEVLIEMGNNGNERLLKWKKIEIQADHNSH